MKVGDYVRVKNTEKDYIEITKIKQFYLDEFVDYRDYDYSVNEIIKSSPNIKDLIEVGDYVNGDKVEKNKYGELYTCYVYCGGDIGRTEESYTLFLKEMDEEDIESILTQEQFESMEYKIGE